MKVEDAKTRHDLDMSDKQKLHGFEEIFVDRLAMIIFIAGVGAESLIANSYLSEEASVVVETNLAKLKKKEVWQEMENEVRRIFESLPSPEARWQLFAKAKARAADLSPKKLGRFLFS